MFNGKIRQKKQFHLKLDNNFKENPTLKLNYKLFSQIIYHMHLV